jgi:hypothetical protein
MDGTSYAEIRHEMLDTLYSYFLQFHRKGATRPSGEEVGFVDFQYEGIYTDPQPRVMKLVVLLGISLARFPQLEERLRSEIAMILNEHSLSRMLVGMAEDDANQLRRDMDLLGLLSEI